MFHLDWRFLPVFDSFAAGSNYTGVYDPVLVTTSVVIAILAAFVALSMSGRIAAAATVRARWAWTAAGAIVMGGGIWAMHFIGMLAFSLPCGIGYDPFGTVLSMVPGALASGVALSIISREKAPGPTRLCVGAVLMGAGIGAMHYTGMAAMEPEALLRYDPVWAAISVFTAIALALVSLSIRFRFGRSHSSAWATLVAATVMGFAVSGMHYAAMKASLFYQLYDGTPLPQTELPPTTLAVLITIFTVAVAAIALVASFAGRQAELAMNLRAEIAERERGEAELIKARHAAEEAYLAKSQFLATMSHEIRTPLNGVIGLANLLASTPLNQRQTQLVDNLARSGRTLLALINDILDFSRIEAHELELFEAPFDIYEVVAEVTDLFAEQCATKGLDLIYAIAEAVPAQLLGDSVRLRQILINLVGNAMKFTERGEILIEVDLDREEDGRLFLSFAVEDTGIGIPADKLDQVFEPFRQADASMTRSRGGSGLGLAISKRLVELKGGEIGVESSLGRGSRFYFTARFRRIADAADTPLTSHPLARPLRTLLVDANALSARVISQYLDSWKIAPTIAGSAAEAKTLCDQAAAAGRPFDVAVIDLKGLGAAGIALARAIRGSAAGGTELILLVSVHNLAGNDEIETLGAYATLTKPARPADLLACLAAIAAGAARTGMAPPVARRVGRAPVPSFEARILVVEDNPVNREVATGMLENMDCQVATAPNGANAVDRVAHESFDLILMDCEMPVMDGFEATRRIREAEAAAADEGRTHLPIVALTAHALAEIREKCLRSGMDDFVVKPFDEFQIGELLRRWIPARERAPHEKPGTRGEAAPEPDDEAIAVIDLGAVNRIRAIPSGKGGSLFERVVAQFTDTAPLLTATLRRHYVAGDVEALWRTAHSLKSSAAALGANRLSRRCAQIENLAREAGIKPVGDLLDALEQDLDAAQTGLRELIGAEHG